MTVADSLTLPARLRRFSPLALVLALLLSPLGPVACAAPGPSADLGCGSGGIPCLKGKAVVSLLTSKGEVQVSLDGDAAPLTAGNFVDLVRRGVYNGTVFHRVVKEPAPFVVQGGDPQSRDPKVPVDQLGGGSFIDPASGQPATSPWRSASAARPSPATASPALAPTNWPGSSSPISGGPGHGQGRGSNSASAQFYIALQALPELDGRYAVFGRVSKGMDVVDRINQGDKLLKATLLSGGTLVKDSR